MQLDVFRTDADFNDAIVPAGYVLVFLSKDDSGNIIKRYKDSNNKFGTIGGAVQGGGAGGGGTGGTDSDVTALVTVLVNGVLTSAAYIEDLNNTAVTISNQLDDIIGE